MRNQIDPAAECIRLLSNRYAGDGAVQNSVAQECENLARKYRIPLQELNHMTAPLVELEAELIAVLEGRQDLWGDMFYPGSANENQLAWSFYMLERRETVEQMPLETLRQWLILSMLALDGDEMKALRDLDSLLALLQTIPCDARTKWACMQTWQDPLRYYSQYRTLIELAEPVIQNYAAQLQPEIDKALSRAVNISESDPDFAWEAVGLTRSSNQIVVIPLCLDFNWQGICWDETCPDSPAYQFVGIFCERIKELVRAYGNRVEQLAEQMKTVTDQSRLEILAALKEGPLCGQELVERLHRTPGTISHHMSQLVRDGFVTVSKQGAKVSYSPQKQKLEELLEDLRLTLL